MIGSARGGSLEDPRGHRQVVQNSGRMQIIRDPTAITIEPLADPTPASSAPSPRGRGLAVTTSAPPFQNGRSQTHGIIISR